MLNKEDIRAITFGNYDLITRYANDKYGESMSYSGLPVDELVNEAIIAVFDFKDGFNHEANIVHFLKQTIDSCYRIEKDSMKQGNFITQKSHAGGNDEYDVTETPRFTKYTHNIQIYAPSDEFMKIYNMFFNFRYKKYGCEAKCQRCGNQNINKHISTYDENVIGRCKVCGLKVRMTARTYVNSLKLSFQKFYKLATLVCKNPNIPSTVLGRRASVTQSTAYKRKILIISVIEAIGESYKRPEVMSRILTAINQDKKPVEIIKKPKTLSYADVYNARRMKKLKIYTVKEIAEIYGRDIRNMRRILKGDLYSHVEQFHEEE